MLVLVDESNVVSSARSCGRNLDWLKLRDYLTGEEKARQLIEMVIYAGMPPAMPDWQSERDKKSKFVHWLRSNGFLVVTKDGSPTEENHYKANIDVMMAIDAVALFRRDAARCGHSRHRRCGFLLLGPAVEATWHPRGSGLCGSESRERLEGSSE